MMSGCHVPICVTGACIACAEIFEKLEKRIEELEKTLNDFRAHYNNENFKYVNKVNELINDVHNLKLEKKINSDVKPTENSGVIFKHILGTTSGPIKFDKPKKQKFEIGEIVYAYDCKRYKVRLTNYDNTDNTYHGVGEECQRWFHEKQIRRIKKKEK